MASSSRETWNRRKSRHQKMGRKRKNKESRKSTLSEVELFAACGEPGQPMPAPQSS